MIAYALNHVYLFLVILSRLLAFVATSPVLSIRIWPAWGKIGLAAVTAMLVEPTLSAHVASPYTNPGEFVVLLLEETSVGIFMGFFANMIFTAMLWAGQMFDLEIGFSVVSEFDPQTGQNSSLTGNFLSILFTLYFLGVNGLDGLMLAVMSSYKFIPVGSLHFPSDTWQFLSHTIALVMTFALEFSAPLLIAMLLSDITFALLSRAVPQMNVFVVGLPAKLFVGLTMFVVVMPGLVYLFGQLFQMLFSHMDTMMKWLGG
ncbi:flagellar biosynthetic protein FliR [Alicyclobacillus sp. SO9]|uniref:flagellar biosynthetic protein FliR n=1 Tax=Alicyclobacillus sp. SO9 TaxID=2665646 RepID=UPI0018E715A7|nr:flagellar biosynthetic protein FliR [Alicyclobacillus sp. SO9]QQE80819.1 flagellar biosynthetic protein FliR [Alicyclobacillus sp. SO9]